MNPIFEKVFQAIEVKETFHDYPVGDAESLESFPDYITRPQRPGDFATSDDAISILDKGNDIPQIALAWNFRSGRVALEALCPVDVVNEWLIAN